MIQSPQPDQNKSELSACKKNHALNAIGLCLIPFIPFLLCLVGSMYHPESSEWAVLFIFVPVFLFVIGMACWQAVDLIRNKGLLLCCRKGRIAVAVALFSVPTVLFATSCWWSWQSIAPFLHSWIAIALLIATILWQTLGCMLLIRAKSPMQSFLLILLFIPSTCFMLLLLPILVVLCVTLLKMF